MAKAPTLASAMTPFPHSISPDAPLEDAHRMMEQHGIHHLPVTDEGTIAGVISHGDVLIAQGVGARDTDVAALIRNEPYVVDIHTRLEVVARTMAARRIGSVVVTRNGKLAGILTHTDVCRVLAELIARLAPESNGDEVA